MPKPPWPHCTCIWISSIKPPIVSLVWKEYLSICRVSHPLVHLGWIDFDVGVHPSCPAAQPLQPNSYQPRHSWVDKFKSTEPRCTSRCNTLNMSDDVKCILCISSSKRRHICLRTRYSAGEAASSEKNDTSWGDMATICETRGVMSRRQPWRRSFRTQRLSISCQSCHGVIKQRLGLRQLSKRN